MLSKIGDHHLVEVILADLEDQVVQEVRVVHRVALRICRECKICRRMIQEGQICAKVVHHQGIQIIVVLLQDRDLPVDLHKEHQEDQAVHQADNFHQVILNDKVHRVSLDNQVHKDKDHLARYQAQAIYSEMQDQEASDELIM